eukprot:gene19683-biopygen41406
MEVSEDGEEFFSARGDESETDSLVDLDMHDVETVDRFFFGDAGADGELEPPIDLANPLYRSAPPPVYPLRREHPHAQLELMRFPRRKDGFLHEHSLADDVVLAGGDWNFCTNGVN